MGGKNLAAIAIDLMLAPTAAWMRMPLLLAETGKGGEPGNEAHRAVAEKMEAAAEGMAAAQLSLARSAASFWPEVMAGKVPALLSGAAAARSVNAALRPTSRRVRDNFTRLSKSGRP